MTTTSLPRTRSNQEKLTALERENEQLKQEIERLRREIERLKNRVVALGG